MRKGAFYLNGHPEFLMSCRTPPLFQAVSLLAASVLLAGCGKQPAGRATEGHLTALTELTDAEKRYGHSATTARGVTYQPDVVLLPAGADAVRSAGSDGISWTIDPGARGADDIQPGKVLLLTSRVAGRVLDVRRTGEGLRVVLGPVEITEVIKDGRFQLDQPVDLDQSLQYPVPEIFDPVLPVAAVVASAPREVRLLPASFASFAPIEPRFTLTPLVGSQGIGVRIVSDASGVHFLGEAVLYLKAPHLYFYLDIKGGRITVCEVRLTGAAGAMMTFEATSPNPQAANISQDRFAPVHFTFPVSGMGVPFAVTVRQAFRLQTAFTSTGALRARVYYELKGELSAGYRDGRWGVGGPTGVKPVLNLDQLLAATQGAALGVSGMVLTHNATVMVGVGAWGFLTGPYGYLNTSVTVTRGPDEGITLCRRATLAMGVGAGVGYMIPEPVTNAINAVLNALNIQERIKSSGGLETKPAIIVNMGRYAPAVEACKG